MPKRSDHGLFFEYSNGHLRAGAFGWIGIVGLIALAAGFGFGRYLGLW
jgi:hypothetical protein